MQTLQSKIFVFFITSLFSVLTAFPNKDLQSSINQADSLYDSEKYTESFIIYDSIFSEKKSYTPQMLMKMAYIKEAMGEYENALYYLNFLYTWHPNQNIANKMESLAQKHKLSGYENNDLQFLYQVFTNYKTKITWTALTIAALLLLSILFVKYKTSIVSYPLIGLSIFVGVFLFTITNLNPFNQKAIVAQNNTLVMSDASSASKLIEVTLKGNRISVIEENNIWYKVEINDTTGYIKKEQLKIIDAF